MKPTRDRAGLLGRVRGERRTRAREPLEGPAGGIEDFVIITGFSGAGKSQAMACFEDAGYFCVDNLPPEMIASLAEGGQVSSAIEQERMLLEPLKERADVAIDTSDLSASRLRKVVADKMLPHDGMLGKMAVTFMTYGFKHGTPRDADLLFDVRFLPNPHYEDRLRDLTGLDEPVREYVENSDGLDDFYGRLIPLLDYLLPSYVREGKAHLTVGVGCTGGRHRSVVIAEHLAAQYKDREEYMVDVVHRDIDKPPRRP